MQDVFNYRDEVIKEYQSFSRSFTNISAPYIKAVVDAEYEEGRYWPEPLIQINPNYKTEKTIDELCADGTLESECRLIFQVDKNEGITDEKFVDREFNSAFLPPYIFDDAKRAVLRAELDAYFARLYGLTRTELQYILDPHSVMGEDYPSETFRVLQEGEIAKYGEYRTQGLVLEAWDRMD